MVFDGLEIAFGAPKAFCYPADILRVVDGDTIEVDLDMGLGHWQHGLFVRLAGLNTPEVRGPEKVAGFAVKYVVEQLVAEARDCRVLSGHWKAKYANRLIGHVWLDLPRQGYTNLGVLLTHLHLCTLWDGTGPRPGFSKSELAAITERAQAILPALEPEIDRTAPTQAYRNPDDPTPYRPNVALEPRDMEPEDDDGDADIILTGEDEK